MAKHERVIKDSSKHFLDEKFCLAADDLPGTPSGWNVCLRQCHGGRSEGVQVVEIHNGRMLVTIILTRGMGIHRVICDNRVLGWQSPIRGPVHPAWVPMFDPTGLGWLEGFDELMCRCGLESNGAPEFDEKGLLRFPLHGRIANLPAERVSVTVDDTQGTITLQGVVEESRFHFQKLRLTSSLTVPFQSTSFAWHDEVTNIGGTPAHMQMLYHMNIGQPFLLPGGSILAPVKSISPRTEAAAKRIDQWNLYPLPEANSVEQVYFIDLLGDSQQRTQVLLKNAEETEGVSLRWSKSALPCFTLWKNTAAEADGYVTGLEPGTNYPNPRSFEESQGRIVVLDPLQSWEAKVTLDWHLSANEVQEASNSVLSLRGSHQPQVFDRPQVGLSKEAISEDT